MARMTKEEAQHLHKILDHSIGVFRDDEMPEKFVKFYEQKKNDFVEEFSHEVPGDFWFHGGDFRSLNLSYDEENGFYLETLLDIEGHLKPILEQTNRKLREADFSLQD